MKKKTIINLKHFKPSYIDAFTPELQPSQPATGRDHTLSFASKSQ